MKYELFGANIEVNCGYCDNFCTDEENFGCRLNREIKNGKCRKFTYNPTLRIPKAEVRMMTCSKEDFEI